MATELTREDILMFSSQSGDFFAKFFLPRTFSLESPPCHSEIWPLIENPENRYVSIEVFRDGAKTTLTRAFVLKSICFGTARLVQFISESRAHSKASLEWIANRIREKTQLEGRPGVKDFFQLKIGKVDNQYELEIENKLYGTKTRIIALGADGQLRGANVDDARPDLIVVDDYLPAEILTDVTMKAYVDKFFSAIENSLAAASLNEFAKIVNLGTRSGTNDVIGKCELDPRWKTAKFSVFTEDGKSAWPSKWTTEELKLAKQAAGLRNQMSIWLREKECKLVKSEQTLFKDTWLMLFDGEMELEEEEYPVYVLSLDPVPPPSANQIKKGLKEKDWECFTVTGYTPQSGFWNQEQTENKGHDINWTLEEAFYLCKKYNIKAFGIESVAYQRTIAFQFREQMKIRREYGIQVYELENGNRSKYHTISDELSPLFQKGLYRVNKNCSSFIQQFAEYPGCDHDDHLDSAAMGIMTMKQYLGVGQYIAHQQGAKPSVVDDEFEKLQKESGMEALCP